MIKIFFMAFALLHSTVSFLHAENIFLDEQFDSLELWEPFYFPKIENHSSYNAGTIDGISCLIAKSNNSASAVLLKEQFNVYEYPNINWRLRISNIYKNGDSNKKDGDDYPIRLFAMFKYDPEKASFAKKVKYEIAKIFYGKYPPHSSISYIWGNKKQSGKYIPNAYSSLSMMIPIAVGQENVGNWLEHKTNLVQDYQAAFGEDPPSMVALAIMSDSDNTGESAKAYIDYIKIYGDSGSEQLTMDDSL